MGVAEEFAKKHGEFVVTVDGHWIYFANGAVRENDPLAGGLGPPTDPVMLAQNIYVYHKNRYARAEAEFKHLRNHHAMSSMSALKTPQGVVAPHDVEGTLRELERLAAQVREIKVGYEAAFAKFSEIDPVQKNRRNQEAWDAKARAGHQALLEKINKINI